MCVAFVLCVSVCESGLSAFADINPLQLSLRVLEIILDLFYAYMANDGVSVDWKARGPSSVIN